MKASLTWIRGLGGRLRRHPVSFLSVVSVLCFLLGLVQFAAALFIFTPADFAVTGVLLATGVLVASAVEFRIIDLTTRLFFATPDNEPNQRADMLAAGFGLQGLLALLVFLISVPALLLAAHSLVERPVANWWIGAVASTAAFPVLAYALMSQLRLLGAFRAFGVTRLFVQLVTTLLVTVLLVWQRNVDGYFLALMLANGIWVATALIVVHRVSVRVLGVTALRLPSWAAFRAHTREVQFLAAGSLLGFANTIARSADILLLAALTNEFVTGTYRVARQASDALLLLSDAVHQFYGPTIVAALSRRDFDGFRRQRAILVGLGVVAASAVVLAVYLVLAPLTSMLVPQHSASVVPFGIMASLLLITIGVHGWLWPALVAQGRIGQFSVAMLTGALAQTLAFMAIAHFGRLDAVSAAGALWFGMLVAYGPLLTVRLVRRLKAVVNRSAS